MACAVLGFFAGVVFACVFPLGLYFNRLMFRLRGPVPFEIDGKTAKGAVWGAFRTRNLHWMALQTAALHAWNPS